MKNHGGIARLLGKVPHLILFLLIGSLGLLISASHTLSLLTQQQLTQALEDLQSTRAILKVNLLLQRAHGLCLQAQSSGDAALFQEAVELTLAAEGFIKGYSYFQINGQSHLIGDVEMLSRVMERLNSEYVQTGRAIPPGESAMLAKEIAHVYETFSDAEADNWLQLSADHALLESRLKGQHRYHLILIGFVCGMALMLVWLLVRKERAESALQKLLGEMESRVIERTAELEEEVSVRRGAEIELRNSQERLQSLMDISPVAIASSNLAGQVRYCNRKFTSLFGYDLEDIPTVDHWFNLAYPDEEYRREVAGRWEGNVAAALRDNTEMAPMEVIVTCKDGGTRHISILAAITRDRLIVIFTDLTERIKAEAERSALEERLRQAQKMEAIGTLAGGIAHDFNNILSAIFGYTEIATLDLGNRAKLQNDLAEILRGAERARDLVKQILTFSRKSTQELQPLKLQFIVKEALKLIRSTLPSDIEIRQEIDPDCDPVLADPTQVHQVVMNLCTNAYHAMRDKSGVLGVRLAMVEVASPGAGHQAMPGRYTVLTVSDTGCGMAPEIREKIFEPYFTTKEKGEGTGLGLAVVHGIVKNLDGHIEVQSEVGRGSTFALYFRAIKSSLPSSDVPADGAIRGGNERILIVDDDPAIAEVQKTRLETIGYRVTGFTDSTEALQAFSQAPHSFDLLITDMTMPKMTGDELSSRILAIRPDFPIILCTGFSSRINDEKARLLGIRLLLMKPLSLKDLAGAIHQLLG